MKKRIIRLLVVLWLAALLRLTVFRNGCFSHGFFSGRIEWAAFAYYAKLIQIQYWRYFTYLFVGNLVWFLPVGVLVRMRNAAPVGRETRPLRKAFPLGEKWRWASHASLLSDERRPNGKLPSIPHCCAPLQKEGRQITNTTDAPPRSFPLLQTAVWGFLLSLGIETLQFVLGSGISELDDLILNTIGAVMGYGLACLWYHPSRGRFSG
ncbi:MAG: VanZ family protein [Oscillospiraceae bacterium]|nr:VanZ family protein [Oscillospiraceae bacterium]